VGGGVAVGVGRVVDETADDDGTAAGDAPTVRAVASVGATVGAVDLEVHAPTTRAAPTMTAANRRVPGVAEKRSDDC
jgi:hypothetical protein